MIKLNMFRVYSRKKGMLAIFQVKGKKKAKNGLKRQKGQNI